MKNTIFELDTGVGLGSHETTLQHPHFALLAVIEMPVTPPMARAQSSNPLCDLYVDSSIGAPIVLRPNITEKLYLL